MYEAVSSQPASAADALRRETEKLGLLVGRLDSMTITGTVT